MLLPTGIGSVSAAVPPPSPLQLSATDNTSQFAAPTRTGTVAPTVTQLDAPSARAITTSTLTPTVTSVAAVDALESGSAAPVGGSPRETETAPVSARRGKPPPPRRVVSFAPSVAEESTAAAKSEGQEDT